MSKMYHIDLTNVPTHEEKWKIYESFKQLNGYWEIYENHTQTSNGHYKSFDSFDMHWIAKNDPVFPSVPDYVSITQIQKQF